MKISILLASTTASLLAGCASAFDGQMAASAYDTYESDTYQVIRLIDYYTGSVYTGYLWGGFNDCVAQQCEIGFDEFTAGGYSFVAKMWRTNDGCHNIDFLGALDSHHGYCCGSLPCDFTA